MDIFIQSTIFEVFLVLSISIIYSSMIIEYIVEVTSEIVLNLYYLITKYDRILNLIIKRISIKELFFMLNIIYWVFQ